MSAKPVRINGSTPAGGVYSIGYHRDDGSMEIVEFDADDREIARTYSTTPEPFRLDPSNRDETTFGHVAGLHTWGGSLAPVLDHLPAFVELELYANTRLGKRLSEEVFEEIRALISSRLNIKIEDVNCLFLDDAVKALQSGAHADPAKNGDTTIKAARVAELKKLGYARKTQRQLFDEFEVSSGGSNEQAAQRAMQSENIKHVEVHDGKLWVLASDKMTPGMQDKKLTEQRN